MEIRTISQECKRRYGQKIYRLSLSSGCTCPNRDGSIGSGGCSFCSQGGSGEFASACLPLEEQIRQARSRVDAKMPASLKQEDRKYIAYFQSFTNTYARSPEELAHLEALYREAILRPEIVLLALGTRPDCLGPDVMAMLRRVREAAPEKPVWIELGLQTASDETAERIRRGYRTEVFRDAFVRLKDAGYEVIVHTMIGLPGENREDVLQTMRYLADLPCPPDGIKIHLLQVLRGTALAAEYEKDPWDLPDLASYAALLTDCLAELPGETVIHRLTGDGPKRLLIAPLWCGDKKRVMNEINRVLRADVRAQGSGRRKGGAAHA